MVSQKVKNKQALIELAKQGYTVEQAVQMLNLDTRMVERWLLVDGHFASAMQFQPTPVVVVGPHNEQIFR